MGTLRNGVISFDPSAIEAEGKGFKKLDLPTQTTRQYVRSVLDDKMEIYGLDPGKELFDIIPRQMKQVKAGLQHIPLNREYLTIEFGVCVRIGMGIYGLDSGMEESAVMNPKRTGLVKGVLQLIQQRMVLPIIL